MQHISKNTRYNIAARLDRMPYAQRQRTVRQIRKDLRLCRSTWSRWLRVSHESKADIPARSLLIIAAHLGVQMAELFNEEKQEA